MTHWLRQKRQICCQNNTVWDISVSVILTYYLHPFDIVRRVEKTETQMEIKTDNIGGWWNGNGGGGVCRAGGYIEEVQLFLSYHLKHYAYTLFSIYSCCVLIVFSTNLLKNKAITYKSRARLTFGMN